MAKSARPKRKAPKLYHLPDGTAYAHLTDDIIEAAKPGDRLPDGLVPGFYLLVSDTGAKLGRVKVYIKGKPKTIALGVWPDVPWTETMIEKQRIPGMREKALEARRLADEDGVDYVAHRRQVKQDKAAAELDTFKTASDDYFRHNVKAWSQNHARDVTRMLAELNSHLAKMPMAKIAKRYVKAALAPMIARGALTYAHDSRMYFRCVWKKYNEDRDIPLPDPSESISIPKAPPVNHHPALPYSQVGHVLHRLNNLTALPQTRIALRLLLLFAVRTSELREARWSEFDMTENLWRIPPSRIKGRQPHLVPLVPATHRLLNDLRVMTGEGELLLPNLADPERPITPNTLLFALYGAGFKHTLTPHGFRAMFSESANEATDEHGRRRFSADAIEKQLAHSAKSADGVRDTYNRDRPDKYLSERRAIMLAWSSYCDDAERAAANVVVPIKREAA